MKNQWQLQLKQHLQQWPQQSPAFQQHLHVLDRGLHDDGDDARVLHNLLQILHQFLQNLRLAQPQVRQIFLQILN